MFTKSVISLFFLVILCKSLSNGELKSDSEPNVRKVVQQHWNQWPNAKWNESEWPSVTWRPPVKHPWPSRPANVGNLPTIYPPLPDYTILWPRPPYRPTPSTPEPPPVDIDNTDTDATTTSTQRPSTGRQPINTQTRLPQTRPPTQSPTQRPTPPSTPGENPSKITVKSCGLSHIPHEFSGNKIVSGKIAKSGEFPWQVILKIKTSKGVMQCGGSILNSRWILTAAHCVSNERDGSPTANRIDITAGVHNRLQMGAGSQQSVADCVIQHESWRGQNGQFKNDVALLRLPTNKLFEITHEKGGNVNGICLPEKPMSEYSGKARISGWGLTKDRGTPSDVLLYTDVSIITNDKCRQYQYPVPIADSMICQGVDRTAPCQGDSGGPLVVPISDKRGTQRMTEVGIVSFGPGQCANAQTPNAIYTKVSHFLKWIEKNIESNANKCVSKPLRADDIEKIDDNSEMENNSTLLAQNMIF